MHGDDITVKGSRTQVEKFMEEFAKVYETKTWIMGGDADLPKSVKILNRMRSWTTERPGPGVGEDSSHAVRRPAWRREGRLQGRRPQARMGGCHHLPGGGGQAELPQSRQARHPVRD